MESQDLAQFSSLEPHFQLLAPVALLERRPYSESVPIAC